VATSQPLKSLSRTGKKVREIPVALRLGRNKFDHSFGGRPDAGALVGPEEEDLVLFDRAPNTAAKLVSLQGIPFGSEKVSRVQGPVTEEFEYPFFLDTAEEKI